MGYGVTAIGVMYNKNLVKEALTSWSALWDPKYRVTFFDGDGGVFAGAVVRQHGAGLPLLELQRYVAFGAALAG